MRKPLMDLWGDRVWFQMRLYSWCVWWPFEVLFINSLLIVHGCSAETPFATDPWSGTTSCPLRWNLWCVPEGRKHCLVSLWTSWHPRLEREEKPFIIQPGHPLRSHVSSGKCLQMGFAWPSLPFGFSFPHLLSPPLSRYLIVVSSNNTALAAAERTFNGGAVLEA